MFGYNNNTNLKKFCGLNGNFPLNPFPKQNQGMVLMKILMRPVDMIFYTTKDGAVIPIKFRISDDQNKSRVIRIDRIISRKEEKLAGNRMLVFTVQSIINGTECLYEMKYEISTCKWFLYKM